MRHAPLIVHCCVFLSCSSAPAARTASIAEAAAEHPARPTTLAELEALTPTLRDRCNAMENQREACSRDWACIPGGPRSGCDHGVCTEGGPMMCLACLDWVALRGRAPPELCMLRASGRNREACGLLFPDEPQRCESVADERASSSAPR